MLSPLRTIADLRKTVRQYRSQGESVGLIPTMGSLHAGHIALLEEAKKETRRQIVTIFVNPAQFGPREDFASYPRQEEADCRLLEEAKADVLFAPSIEEMYPSGFLSRVEVGALADRLCGPFRPGHFSGVATIVTKLLLQSLPDCAYFGEKDFQQLRVIQQVTKDLDIPVSIRGVPTKRETDGLALSSRNAYLSPEQRQKAFLLPHLLETIAEKISQGQGITALLAEAKGQLMQSGFGPIDYFELADEETLSPVSSLRRPARLFAAVYLGKTRLIDNWKVGTS